MKLLSLITQKIGLTGTVLLKHTVLADEKIRTTLTITVEGITPEETNQQIYSALMKAALEINGTKQLAGEIQTLKEIDKIKVELPSLKEMEHTADMAMNAKDYHGALHIYNNILDRKYSKKIQGKAENAARWLKQVEVYNGGEQVIEEAGKEAIERFPGTLKELADEFAPKINNAGFIEAEVIEETTEPQFPKLYRDLSEEETADFKAYARENYQAGSLINDVWHPVIKEECELINREFDEEIPTVVGSVMMEDEDKMSPFKDDDENEFQIPQRQS